MVRAQVFGVTRDPFIIWTSNMFAIASLRALYGLVANVLAELRFLEKAIALVLAWIGAKMIIEVRGPAIWQLLPWLRRLLGPGRALFATGNCSNMEVRLLCAVSVALLVHFTSALPPNNRLSMCFQEHNIDT